MTLKGMTESNLGATINRFGLNVGVRKKRVERRGEVGRGEVRRGGLWLDGM